MSRRTYRRRRTAESELVFGMVIVVGGVVLIAYQKLSSAILELFIAGLLMAAVIMIGVVLLLHWKRTKHEKAKSQALSMVDIHVMDGLVFEEYVAELLKSQGYTQVTLTERYDYGVDIIAVKDGIRWGVQVKRHNDMVKAAAVRQVVTALNHYKCQRAMVVTNSVFSRPAKSLAASNNCTLIDHEKLGEWMVRFRGIVV